MVCNKQRGLHVIWIVVGTVFFFMSIFVLSERSFFLQTIHGDLTFKVLKQIVPSLLYDFFYRDAVLSTHYLLVSALSAFYFVNAIPLFRHMRRTVASGVVGILGNIGIVLGVSCVTCGTVLAYFFLSFLGFSTGATLFFLDGNYFLYLGEALLFAASILIVRSRRSLGE